jgi:Zinc finger, C3HC4 type (RING finger)
MAMYLLNLSFRLLCGHSLCYVCIRTWLDVNWTCPQCRAGILCPPMPNFAKELAIARDHPEWVDLSTVTYSFKGLRFPIPYDPDSD